MAKHVKCPQCGAGNGLDQRRCRLCGQMLNPDIPDEGLKPKGLPEKLQLEIQAEFGDTLGPTYIPGERLVGDDLGRGDIGADPFAGAPAASGAGAGGGGGGGSSGADGIVIDAPSRYAAPDVPPVIDEEPERFDPDALFRDMGREPPPPPPRPWVRRIIWP